MKRIHVFLLCLLFFLIGHLIPFVRYDCYKIIYVERPAFQQIAGR